MQDNGAENFAFGPAVGGGWGAGAGSRGLDGSLMVVSSQTEHIGEVAQFNTVSSPGSPGRAAAAHFARVWPPHVQCWRGWLRDRSLIRLQPKFPSIRAAQLGLSH